MHVQDSQDKNVKIAAIAYRIWEEEGRPDGKDVEHWNRAEKIFNQQNRSKETTPSPESKGNGSGLSSTPRSKQASVVQEMKEPSLAGAGIGGPGKGSRSRKR